MLFKRLNKTKRSLFITYINKKKINIKGRNRLPKNIINHNKISSEGKLIKSNHETIEGTKDSFVNSHNNSDKSKNKKENYKYNTNFKMNFHSSLLNPKYNQENHRIIEENFRSIIKTFNLTYEEKKPILNAKNKYTKKNIFDFIDEELNEMGFSKAIKYDKRTYWQYYFSLLKSNHLIIKIFNNNDYNSRIIKIFLAFFNFGSVFAVNTLFFNDETMHKIHEDGGNFNFFYQLPQIIYSTVITDIIDYIINSLALSQDNILSVKHLKVTKKFEQITKHTINLLMFKFIVFFIISFLLTLLYSYYIGCFCAVYKNTQHHLIKDILISFLTGNLYPFIMSLLPGIFRIRALAQRNKSMYKFSKFLAWF